MLNVAHETVAAAHPEVDTLARRLMALRSEIDAVLAELSRAAAAVSERADCADEAAEEPPAMPAIETTDEPAAPEDCTLAGSKGESRTATSDDLTLIRGIDDQLCEELNGLGIVVYAQIAGWTAQDVADVEQALGLRRVISKENWIEQAAILASGKLTDYTGSGSDYPLAYDADLGTSEADVFMLERVARAPLATARHEPKLAPFGEISPESEEITQGAGVPSLDPYRGVPTHTFSRQRASVGDVRGRGALGLKVAACLVALVVAGLAMVGRDAWGSMHLPTRKKAALPLQVHEAAGSQRAGEHDAAWVAFESDRFKAAYRQ
jgi:predicted flap endonuclease-1-like 5' DNA nuclease